MDTKLMKALPIVVAATLVSVFSACAYFGGDSSSSSSSNSPKKRLRSLSSSTASANNVHLGESQNYLPTATRHGQSSLQLSGELHEIGDLLANSSNRRRESYSNITSRYPLTARLSHVVEALDELRQLQRDTEIALEAQSHNTEQEKILRMRMEQSLRAESRLREEAESNIQMYKDLLQKLRSEQESAQRAVQENASRIKMTVSALTSMIKDGSISENSELALQLLSKLSQEA